MSILRREFLLITHSVRDLLIRVLPVPSKKEYKFAFLVHPRNARDVHRKYPILSRLPSKMTEIIVKSYWPVLLSNITGLKSSKTGKEIRGMILAVPLTARQMMENRELARKRIIQAVVLAKKHGAKIIGLGGLTSSLSRGGIDVIENVSNICVTTGHAYTAYNVTQNFFSLVEVLGMDKAKVKVAVVGAAGSVGSTSSKILARGGVNKIILIDLERKKGYFQELSAELKKLNSNIEIETSHKISDISSCDFIITATNAPEALIESRDLKSGAVVIDDAQPSDVAPDVLKRDDVLVVEAGVVHTPNINSHFNFNLKDKYDNFCCLAEVLLLATEEHDEHYVINRATLKHVDEVSMIGKNLGFRIGEFQNFNERISGAKIDTIKRILNARS